ncbi:MAG: hypothetical protein WCE23_11470 [Candidatus Binatus sp.]|uniref:hypothetical protein n=1 Tax=Candidatus Binatus sp. TaxID=2811406 RepID=UPI003C767B42
MPASPSQFGGWDDAASRGLIVVVAIALAWYTWAHWGDIQIDCGRELYVPSEILRGKLIYRDIFYPYGPLAPYAGALLIAIFGTHLVVFYLFGIAVAIGCAMLLFELGAMLEGRAAGLAAALALLSAGFAPGFANYVFPYSYAATIGLALSLICALFTLRHLFGRWGYNLLLAGLAASLATLCKQEFGAACYLMLAFVLVTEAARGRSIRPLTHGIAACAPGVALWVAIYGGFFWTLTPAFMVDANWVGLPGTAMHAYGAHLYYLDGQHILRQMLLLILSAVVSPRLWFLLAKASRISRNVILGLIVAIAVACRFGFLVWAARAVSELLIFPEGMFFIGCGFVAYSIYELNRKGDRRRLAEAAFGIFALVPALRVFEGITPYGYSIYFAMPLFLAFVVAISRCIKAATPALSVNQQRGLVNYLLAAEVVMLALICIPQTSERLATLETSWGAIRLEPEEANVARQILAFMSEQKREGRRVAVLPEAPILYALTGTEAPGRWYMVVPGILSLTQENVLLTDLNRAAPDYILLTARMTHEYGADYFGIDYDQKIYHWIESNYRVAGQFGRFRRDESGSTTQAPLAALLYEKEEPGHGDRSR